MQEPRFRRTRFIGIGLVVVVVFGVLVFAVQWRNRAEARRWRLEIDTRLERIRAAGQPVTSEDLARLYPDPPPERDAVALLSPVLGKLSLPNESSNIPLIDTNGLPQKGAALDEELRSKLSELVGNNAELLAKVPREQLRGTWAGEGFASGFVHPAAFRDSQVGLLVRILCLQAILEADRGDGSKAAEALGSSFATLELSKSSNLRHFLGYRAYGSSSFSALEWVLNRTAFSDRDIKLLERTFPDERPDGLRDSFIDMRCYSIWQMEKIRLDPQELMPTSPSSGWKYRIRSWWEAHSGRLYCDEDYVQMLDNSEAGITAMALPPRKRFEVLRAIKPGVRKDGKRATRASQLIGGDPNVYFDRARWDLELLAGLRTARTALAIERWRIDHAGNLPESLGELAPAYLPKVPVDPFTDQPLRYQKLAKGYCVYSVGPDFVDDGGKEKPVGAKKDAGWDVTFTVER